MSHETIVAARPAPFAPRKTGSDGAARYFVGETFDLRRLPARLRARATTADYDARAVVLVQGDPNEFVFYINRGHIALSIVSPRGKEAVTSILNHGSFFGEGCLNGHPRSPCSARTMTASSLTRIPRRTMMRALDQNAPFARHFVTYLVARNIRFEEDLADQLLHSSEKRLARLLLRLARFDRDGRIGHIEPEIGQQMLARMVGTTRERVSSFMATFRRRGFIQHNGGLCIRASLRTVAVAK